jgi:hypothetical protein
MVGEGQYLIEHGGSPIEQELARVERVGLRYQTWIFSGGGRTKNALFVMEEEVADHHLASVASTGMIVSSCEMQCHVADLAVSVVGGPKKCLESGALQPAKVASEFLQVVLEGLCHCSSTSQILVGRIQGETSLVRVQDWEKTGTLCAMFPLLG